MIDYDGQWLNAQVRTSNGLVDDDTKGDKFLNGVIDYYGSSLEWLLIISITHMEWIIAWMTLMNLFILGGWWEILGLDQQSSGVRWNSRAVQWRWGKLLIMFNSIYWDNKRLRLAVQWTVSTRYPRPSCPSKSLGSWTWFWLSMDLVSTVKFSIILLSIL